MKPSGSWSLVASLLMIVGIIWSVRYLPMVDYPQHLAQISLWVRSGDTTGDFANWYELNWFTPYLLGYGLARLLEPLLGVETAMRVVLTCGLIGLPLAVRFLLRELDLDEDWALASCFLVFGYSFSWGFFNFLLALPVGIAFLGIVIRACHHDPGQRLEVWAPMLTAILLFFSHAMAWVVIVPVSAALIRQRMGSWSAGGRLILYSLVPSGILGTGWLALIRWSEPSVSYPTMWSSLEQAQTRFLELAGNLAGDPSLAAAWPLLLLTIFLAACSGLGFKREPWSWLPFLIGLGWYFAGPFAIWGTSHLAQRMAVFLPVLLLPALERRGEAVFRSWRYALAALVCGWLLMVGWRFQMFDREAREFEPVRAAIPAGSKVLGLIFLARSEFAPFYPFVQFPAYVQVDKPAMINFSFAFFIPEIVRYKPGVTFGWKTPMELEPLKHYTIPGMNLYRLNWQRDAAYDRVLVRAEYDVAPQILFDSPWRWKLVASNGSWWLYAKS